jgi:hypothetical protein
MRHGHLSSVDQPHCAPDATFCNWGNGFKASKPLDPAAVHSLKMVTEGPWWKVATPDIIGLWEGGRDAPLILLDTNYGIVYWPDCDEGIRHGTSQEQVEDDSEVWASKEEIDWRCDAPAWTVSDFFAMLREQFEQLHFIPVCSMRVIYSDSGYLDNCKMERMVQGIYREHGWPDLELYRKEECMQAVEKAPEEQYPDFYPY